MTITRAGHYRELQPNLGKSVSRPKQDLTQPAKRVAEPKNHRQPALGGHGAAESGAEASRLEALNKIANAEPARGSG